MKGKFLALLTALLLTVSLIPTNTPSVDDAFPLTPSTVTVTTSAPEEGTEDLGSAVPPCGSGSGGADEDPGAIGKEH